MKEIFDNQMDIFDDDPLNATGISKKAWLYFS